jgi:type IV pilus assembly protein PilW
LYCQGRATASAQPLVENVVEMHLWFGVADIDADTGKLKQIKRYVVASDVGALPGSASNWDQVKAVRVCLVIRSADEVLPSATAYKNCANTSVTPTDRRVYRAFTTTVVLNNRVSTL